MKLRDPGGRGGNEKMPAAGNVPSNGQCVETLQQGDGRAIRATIPRPKKPEKAHASKIDKNETVAHFA